MMKLKKWLERAGIKIKASSTTIDKSAIAPKITALFPLEGPLCLLVLIMDTRFFIELKPIYSKGMDKKINKYLIEPLKR
jgi:hypothetical protein